MQLIMIIIVIGYDFKGLISPPQSIPECTITPS